MTERQRAWRLREWSVRESEGDNPIEVREREREIFSEIQILGSCNENRIETRIANLDG